tara:strand:+ start:2289 stop:2702 length:414 start_codon:yes stop_codon:yes gene_type:complete
MNWADYCSHPVLKDAWETYKTHFTGINPNVNIEHFIGADYRNVKLKELKSGKIENLSVERMSALSADIAYSDRPRGASTDVQSVLYHMSHTCSPIVILETTDPTGVTRYILLDGMHRLVAASLLNKRIARALWIYVP